METVFLKILNMSFTASFLILAVVLLRPFIYKLPKWINIALWGFVGFRLLCPFSFESVLSLIPSANPIPADITISATPHIKTNIEVLNSGVNEYIFQNLTPNVGDSVNPMQILFFVLTVLWVVGISAIIIYSLVSYIRLHKKVMVSSPLRDNIYICDNISSPFILGFVKPKIYLPAGLTAQQENYVISHEQAHISRRDHIIKPFAFLVLILHWFNPFVWVAYTLFCKDIELACDSRVVKTMSATDKKQYSSVLLDLSVPNRTFLSQPVAIGEVGVKSRIKSVLNYKKPTFWVILVGLIIAILVGALFLTNPTVANEVKDINSTLTSSEMQEINKILTNENSEAKGDFEIGKLREEGVEYVGGYYEVTAQLMMDISAKDYTLKLEDFKIKNIDKISSVKHHIGYSKDSRDYVDIKLNCSMQDEAISVAKEIYNLPFVSDACLIYDYLYTLDKQGDYKLPTNIKNIEYSVVRIKDPAFDNFVSDKANPCAVAYIKTVEELKNCVGELTPRYSKYTADYLSRTPIVLIGINRSSISHDQEIAQVGIVTENSQNKLYVDLNTFSAGGDVFSAEGITYFIIEPKIDLDIDGANQIILVVNGEKVIK